MVVVEPQAPSTRAGAGRGLTQSAARRWGAWRPAAPGRGTGTCGQNGRSGPSAAWDTGLEKAGGGSQHLPLRKLRRPHLLTGGVHVAHHEVLRDLLHVLEVEEGVEAELVCKDTPLSCG